MELLCEGSVKERKKKKKKKKMTTMTTEKEPKQAMPEDIEKQQKVNQNTMEKEPKQVMLEDIEKKEDIEQSQQPMLEDIKNELEPPLQTPESGNTMKAMTHWNFGIYQPHQEDITTHWMYGMCLMPPEQMSIVRGDIKTLLRKSPHPMQQQQP